MSDHSPSLTIAIPTYRRPAEFARLLGQVAEQIKALNPGIQSRMKIVVLDNPSESSEEKCLYAEGLHFGESLFRWIQNDTNIGADRNINNAYKCGSATDYVWVIGDDEQLFPGAIQNVMGQLLVEPSADLFILFGNQYPFRAKEIGVLQWPNYASFASSVATVQPHALIAHSLISLNIVRSSIYNNKLAEVEISLLSKRWGLPFCFAHMKGIVGGLSSNNDSCVAVVMDPIVDCSCRSPSHVPLTASPKMFQLHAIYIFWLIHEYGLPISAFYADPSLGQHLLPGFSGLFGSLVYHINAQICRKMISLLKPVVRSFLFLS